MVKTHVKSHRALQRAYVVSPFPDPDVPAGLVHSLSSPRNDSYHQGAKTARDGGMILLRNEAESNEDIQDIQDIQDAKGKHPVHPVHPC